MNSKMRFTSSIVSSRILIVLALKQARRTRFFHLAVPEISAPTVGFNSGKVFARDFHGGTPVLDFRASSFLLQPGYAVAVYLDEDRLPKDSGDCLDISKLGISHDIVSA